MAVGNSEEIIELSETQEILTCRTQIKLASDAGNLDICLVTAPTSLTRSAISAVKGATSPKTVTKLILIEVTT